MSDAVKVTVTIEVPEAEFATEAWFEVLSAFPEIGARVTGVYVEPENARNHPHAEA